MSVRAITEVLDNSKAKGSLLLLELVLADTANEYGYCWPGVEYLAKKSRMSPRNVVYLLRKLENINELFVDPNGGPRGTNMYLLLLVSKGAIPAPPLQPASGVQTLHPAKSSPEIAPESSGTGERERDAIQPPAGSGEQEPEASQPGDFPNEAEVMAFAAAYPGCPAVGTPPVMTKDWAQGHYDYHSFTVGWWAVNWKEDMKRRYEREWRDGKPRARGTQRQVSSGPVGGANFKKNGAPQRERGEILQELAWVREARGDTKALEEELKALR